MATVKELREEAKRLGLKGYSRMNKAELEAAINSRTLELREETGKRIAEQANSHADQAQDEQTDNMIDILDTLPAYKIRRIARIVKLPRYSTFTTSYLRGRLHCWIFSEDGCNGLRALAVKLSRDDFMEIVNVIGTEDLRDELYPIFSFKYLENMTRDDCISNAEWCIFIRENLKIRQYDKIPDRWQADADELREFILAQERREQEDRKREKYEEMNARREYYRQRREAEDFRNAFMNAQRTLAAQVAFITRYMKAKPATAIAALPATVQHQHEHATSTAILPALSPCPHCGSRHKPYFSYKKGNNACYATRRFNGGYYHEWKEARLTCRDCGHVVSVFPSKPYPDRDIAMASCMWKWISQANKTAHQPALPVELVEHQDAQATSQKVNDCILAPELITKCIKSELAQRVADNAYCKKQREAMGLGNGYDLGFFPDECSPDFFPRIWTKQQLAMAHSIMFWWKQYFSPLPEKIFWEKYRHSVWNNHAYAHSGEGYEGIITLKKYSKKYLLELADDIGLNLHDGKYSRLDMVKLITMECYKATFINYATAPTASEIIDAEFAEPEQLQLENPTVAQEVNYPAPVKKRKSHRNIPTDTSRQILICFDDEETPDAASIQAKPQRRVTRKPRIKRDYSRQLIFVFDEVPDSNAKQRKAA